jgi:hypothetical protein
MQHTGVASSAEYTKAHDRHDQALCTSTLHAPARTFHEGLCCIRAAARDGKESCRTILRSTSEAKKMDIAEAAYAYEIGPLQQRRCRRRGRIVIPGTVGHHIQVVLRACSDMLGDLDKLALRAVRHCKINLHASATA